MVMNFPALDTLPYIHDSHINPNRRPKHNCPNSIALPEQLIVAVRALEERRLVIRRPGHQPVTRICHMALATSGSATTQAMHIMTAFENLHRLGRVLQHQVDELPRFVKVPLAALRLPLQIAREGGGELGSEPSPSGHRRRDKVGPVGETALLCPPTGTHRPRG